LIPTEEYLGIKGEWIHKEMVFETIELYWDFQDKIILANGLESNLDIDNRWKMYVVKEVYP
jgi:hypothetical protein